MTPSATTTQPPDATSAEEPDSVRDITPTDLHNRLERGDVVLVDVREPYERASARIPGSVSQPLSTFDPAAISGDAPEVVFQCRTGKRSLDAAHRYIAARGGSVRNLAGGIEAWKQAGLETERSAGAPPIDIMRQVQIAAGSLVLIGVILGVVLSPWFLIISGFVGAGLVFAGASGWCGMAKMLGVMPWNRA